MSGVDGNFFTTDQNATLSAIGNERLIAALTVMIRIRNFEIRAESGYQHGKIGGFFHAYMGQEAIQTAAIDAIGIDGNWWTTTYRCHALAILMGNSLDSLMAELYGKATGNAMGRGGSMHLYADRMLGGFGIVGGHVPIAAGAAFSLKYQKQPGLSVCFLGDGATVQGAVHESLNLAALWKLPALVVIENNQWGMGTAVNRAVAATPIAEHLAKAYDISSYTLDGMDYISCYAAFSEAAERIRKEGKPILMEAITERFRGHSISDPGLYRSKESVKKVQERDPIRLLSDVLIAQKVVAEDEIEAIQQREKEAVLAAMKFAEESPAPDPVTLEEDVFAP